MSEQTRIYLDAVLYPHRSLSMPGFFALMAVLAGLSFAGGMYFVLHGAWPVMGFFGLDVLAVYVAFRLSYRSGRMTERVTLSNEALSVTRQLPSGTSDTWSFEPSWAQVEIGDDPRPDNHLTLKVGQERLILGGFMAPAERIAFADTLRAALATRREQLPHS